MAKDAQVIDLFEAMGGSAKCRELSTVFYAGVAKDSTLRPLFPGKNFKCAIEEFAAFLTQLFGGPPEETQRRWWLSLRESHRRFQIGQKERDAWMRIMTTALNSVEIDGAMRSELLAFFAQSSAYVVNTGQAVPAAGCLHGQMQRRWDEQLLLDEAVAAIREGVLDRVIALVGSPLLQSRFARSRSVFANFAGVLIGSGHSGMAEYAHRILLENPDLADRQYSGRTLLHAASAAGNSPIVRLLLKLGVDASIKDMGGHAPLYCAANECPSAGAVVRVLVQGGAHVDACDGVKQCTALHMAARRGHVEVAEALLDCGANIEARDSLGESPLRRAVNCGKTAVTALLLARGADLHSQGSKGLTPLLAARAKDMRDLLFTWDAKCRL